MPATPDALSTAEEVLEAAKACLAARKLGDAVTSFDHAELLGAPPDACSAGRWTAHMLAGNFAAAWHESDSIRARGAPDPHRFWQGENLLGRRVILRSLHGFGDAVQFLRYVPEIRKRASTLIVEVAPAMAELAACFDGVVDVCTWETADERNHDWDVQVEVTELPYLFRTEVRDLPVAQRYLSLPGELGLRMNSAIGCSANPRVGMVWAAGDWNPKRSLPFDTLAPLLKRSDCEFWNLQGGAARAQWDKVDWTPHLRDGSICSQDMASLAAVIEKLDLVITVDTLAAHLAGALGKPTWVLLQHAADWRWMTHRTDSPWYPSVRLFRQPSPGNWNGTVLAIEQELVRWLASR